MIMHAMSRKLPSPLEHLPTRPVSWRGRSGRTYAMVRETLDSFVMDDQELYVLTSGDKACWVGTAGDLIGDGRSRARFREAVRVANSVLRIARPSDDVTTLTTMWDLEGGEPDALAAEPPVQALSA